MVTLGRAAQRSAPLQIRRTRMQIVLGGLEEILRLPRCKILASWTFHFWHWNNQKMQLLLGLPDLREYSERTR